MRFTTVITAAATAILMVPMAAHAATPNPNSVTLQTIHGQVTDPIGRPLRNVAVSDGNHVVYTGSDGAYSISELLPGSYQITISHVALDPLPPRTVGPLRSQWPVDFVETYRLGAAIVPSEFDSTTTSEATIRVDTYAPYPGSCVFWQDASSGTIVPLSVPVLPRGDDITWSGHFAVGGLAPGTYNSAAWATDCHDHLLSLVRSATYTVDTATV